MSQPANTRRDFVKTAAGLSMAAAAASGAELGDIPKRRLGRTDMDVTIIGLGGARVGNLADEKQAIDTIRRCYDLGINYFDTAAAGAYGISQSRYGRALADVNKNIYIGTKTRNRTYDHCLLDLNQSLGNMKRDWIDLYMVHNVLNEDDIQHVFGPNGTMELVEKAKRDGKIRYVGFTGHQDPRVLNKIMGMYDWDAVLMPLSVSDGAREDFSFERTTLPAAVDKGLGVIAMKTTGVGVLHKEGVSTLAENLNYVWSLPVATAILGCTSPEMVDEDVKIAVATQNNQMSEADRRKLNERWASADLAKLEPWKVDTKPLTVGIPEYLGD